MSCLRKKKGPTSFYEFITACQPEENWAEELIISLIRGNKDQDTLKKKMRQMIMKSLFLEQNIQSF